MRVTRSTSAILQSKGNGIRNYEDILCCQKDESSIMTHLNIRSSNAGSFRITRSMNSSMNANASKLNGIIRKTSNQAKKLITPSKVDVEVWDMIRHANTNDKKKSCSMKGCQRQVISVWATNLKPKDEWFTCEPCQQVEFNGWPEGEEPTSMIATETTLLEKQASRRITRSMDGLELDQCSISTPSAKASVISKKKSKPKKSRKSSDQIQQIAPSQELQADEVWDMIRHANANDTIAPCSTKGCIKAVVAVWASNLNPKEEWFTCEACQEKDFGGWPEEEVPLAQLFKKMTKSKSKKDPIASNTKRSCCAEQNPNSHNYQPPIKKRKSRKLDNSVTLTHSSKSAQCTNQASKQGMVQTYPLALRPPPYAQPNNPLRSPPPLLVPQHSAPAFASIPPHATIPRHSIPVSPLLDTAVDGPQIGVPNLVEETSESNNFELADHRVMATIQRRKLCVENDKKRNKWTPPKLLYATPKNVWPSPEPLSFRLRRGGFFEVFPNLVSPARLARVEHEVLNSGLFRQYSVQGQDEPRAHFLLHGNATDDFEAMQPGYSYANVWVKARPLSKLPELEALAKELALFYGVDSWNIGVNPVLYRGSKDSMGEHADDDQGEQVILCLIVSSPKGARRVRITPKAKGEETEDDDERVDLMLSVGDVYVMDGEMQEHYFHAVPKTTGSDFAEDSFRLSIVFRTGRDFSQWQDSGRPCENLAPKTRPPQIFGNNILGLHEGRLYTRIELFNMGAHRMQQRGISGNIKAGADAMIVSGLREDKLGCDHFCQLVYAVEKVKGGMSVVTSYNANKPIRVFRSSNYDSPFKATSLDDAKDNSTRYRYDGLYKVVKMRNPVVSKGPFIFELHRLEAGIEGYSNEHSNRDVFAKYTEMGSIKIQEDYATARTCQNLIQKVVDKAMEYYTMKLLRDMNTAFDLSLVA